MLMGWKLFMFNQTLIYHQQQIELFLNFPQKNHIYTLTLRLDIIPSSL